MTPAQTFAYNGQEYHFQSLVAGDHFDRWYRKGKTFYELRLLEAIRARKLVGTYVDVGSNIGNHSVYFMTQCLCSELICIEPKPELREVFQQNLVNNGCAPFPLVLHPVAVSNETCRVAMSPVSESNARVVSQGAGDVQAHSLDIPLGAIQGVAVLKLDIEGYECKAIEGAKNFLRRNRPLIAAELQDSAQFRAFKELLAPYGYATDGKNYAGTPTYLWEPKK